MSPLDWSILVGTIGLIVTLGVLRTRGIRDLRGFLRGGNQMKWYTIGLSVMATQASAITFLSTPGQAYEDGMRFVQFYFGLPLAMVVLCATLVPRYYRLDVYTAYEYLERRFDLKTRLLAALLFLLQRGLSAGVTIYAPAIIISSMLGWSLQLTTVAVGAVVIVYTVSGGTRAVSQTQMQQMIVILVGMVAALLVGVQRLPDGIGIRGALTVAGALGRINAVDLSLDLSSRYTLVSGLTGGFFLAMAYFGTDQSQVQRYLSGRSLRESRLGLLFNGLVKVPMQCLILFIGLIVFVLYVFQAPPVFFNQAERARVDHGAVAGRLAAIDAEHQASFDRRRVAAQRLLDATGEHEAAAARVELRSAHAALERNRGAARAVIKAANPQAETKDADYVFITFVLQNLPRGLIGLLLAVILSAAMSSTASELNALSSTTVVDFYKRVLVRDKSEAHYLRASQVFTVFWGACAIAFAMAASLIDNLVQAVNILGSLFYGTILGLFVAAFTLRRVGGTSVFIAALVSEVVVIALFLGSSIGFLWYNVVGCALVLVVAPALELTRSNILGAR